MTRRQGAQSPPSPSLRPDKALHDYVDLRPIWPVQQVLAAIHRYAGHEKFDERVLSACPCDA